MLATSELQNLVRCAEDGDPYAQYALAERYHRGDGIPRNYLEAERWYLRRVEQGSQNAQLGLGLLYLDCLGNRAEGLRLLELAGKQGEVSACYQLGQALSQPRGQDRDPVAAYIWFCIAEAGGIGCEKEIEKLEAELSAQQVLGAQLRAREEFHLVAEALRAAKEAEALRAAEAAKKAEERSEISASSLTAEWPKFTTPTRPSPPK